jgi:hypothetical protein
VGIDTASDEARITRAKAVAQLATATPEYGTDPAYKGSIDGVVTAGGELATAVDEVSDAEAVLRKARGTRDAKRRAFQKANAAAVTQVERFSTKPEDITTRGYVALDPTTGLAMPIGIQVDHDANTGILDIFVEYPAGRRTHRCVIAISPSPAGTYQELEGYGRRRSSAGYPPGTYWVRACTLLATKRSPWFGPVAVIVK